jgi:hypothetical protein
MPLDRVFLNVPPSNHPSLSCFLYLSCRLSQLVRPPPPVLLSTPIASELESLRERVADMGRAANVSHAEIMALRREVEELR